MKTPDRHSTRAEWIAWMEWVSKTLATEMRPKDLGLYLANQMKHGADSLKE